ncbi:DUF3307 domain-containing protein [Epibacterium ulvae]|uniref:DUF3307 domain-containing protein n=1 Tax=Epibacterium ulvae TaxID=1156985 RepID=UPI001BFC1677|nr:DUF3307 domain-containing protein [Epibacterium ulvae]MBT8153989.1 DUF3307 domain-containing protein [Epibacterium ulvae]
MSEHVASLLALLLLLQVKHMFADFYLQTPRMLSGRSLYFHMGRAQHASVHLIGTACVLTIMSAPLKFAFIICILEWIAHFHIDFGKARYNEMKDLKPTQSLFWWAMGTDQALHQATYLGMGWAWCVFVLP